MFCKVSHAASVVWVLAVNSCLNYWLSLLIFRIIDERLLYFMYCSWFGHLLILCGCLSEFPDDVNPVTKEKGGPRGPEPTRYGDWERKGRCVDFWDTPHPPGTFKMVQMKPNVYDIFSQQLFMTDGEMFIVWNVRAVGLHEYRDEWNSGCPCVGVLCMYLFGCLLYWNKCITFRKKKVIQGLSFNHFNIQHFNQQQFLTVVIFKLLGFSSRRSSKYFSSIVQSN